MEVEHAKKRATSQAGKRKSSRRKDEKEQEIESGREALGEAFIEERDCEQATS